MLTSSLIAILGIVGLMLGWVGVQALWGRTFAEEVVEEDVLAGRSDCGSCGCGSACTRRTIPNRPTNKRSKSSDE